MQKTNWLQTYAVVILALGVFGCYVKLQGIIAYKNAQSVSQYQLHVATSSPPYYTVLDNSKMIKFVGRTYQPHTYAEDLKLRESLDFNSMSTNIVDAILVSTGLLTSSTEYSPEVYKDYSGRLHINPNSYTEGITFSTNGVKIGK